MQLAQLALIYGSGWLTHDSALYRWVDIAFADIDTISIFLTQNIPSISISFTAALSGLLISFVIASKVVNYVNVIP